MVRSVHHGTHIEGNELNLDQAEKVIEGQDVVARQRDIQEVINYRRVMEHLGEMKDEKGKMKIDEAFIKQLHEMTVEKILAPEKTGKFRTTQVVVKNSLTGDVTFRPPAAIAIPVQINDFLEFVNETPTTDIHPVLKSGIV